MGEGGALGVDEDGERVILDLVVRPPALQDDHCLTMRQNNQHKAPEDQIGFSAHGLRNQSVVLVGVEQVQPLPVLVLEPLEGCSHPLKGVL